MNIRKILTSILPWKRYVTCEPAVSPAVLNTAQLCIKKRIFHSQNGTILLSINVRIEFYLFVSQFVMKDRESTCKFGKIYKIYMWTRCLSYHYEKQTSRIQSLNEACPVMDFANHGRENGNPLFLLQSGDWLFFSNAVLFLIKKLDMCLWNTAAPSSNKIKIWQNL